MRTRRRNVRPTAIIDDANVDANVDDENDNYVPLDPHFLHDNHSQRRIYYNERKQNVKGNQLLQADHWAYALRNVYNDLHYLQHSGRDYNGSEDVFKNIEHQRFYDHNDNATEIKVAYIYIISKRIGNEQFFKVGVGGTGQSARLNGGQTFLIPGLGEEVGFKASH